MRGRGLRWIANTQLMVAWSAGVRSAEDAHRFIRMVAHRVQITTDGLSHFTSATEGSFGWSQSDYAQVVKEYGYHVENERGERRYSPSTRTGFFVLPIMGTLGRKSLP